MSLLSWTLLLRDLYTCFVGSCQTEGKSFSPISAAISRESFCLVTLLERDRAEWIIDGARWTLSLLWKAGPIVNCITWNEGSAVYYLQPCKLFFFLPLLALYLQPFSFFCLFSFPFPNFPVTYSLKSKTPLLKSALTPLIIKFGRIYLMMRVCCQSCR